ncbi:SDR family oxidoreductase [Neolewinella litorea]|uniref:SDR family oxidoreductase n=1 Tax=Neolewinella litorea TaxID=2562452 RepID=A0A4S4NMD0_9BACT|nr:SDR family oxidoreductase [Neolewinella litorea]THH39518.1 SDR family oxidoreductase [Neolewinella litorea]
MKLVNKLFSLENRTVVVGGGAGQIGFSLCKILVDAGAHVLIADIDGEMAAQKVAALEDEASRERIHVYPIDVSNKSEVHRFFQQASASHGLLYGLINCFHFKGNTRKLDTASNFFAPFEDYPEEAWDMVHEVNLKGSFLMSQAAIPYFQDNGCGVIVNISSTYGNVSANKHIYGDSGINSPVAYGTSKAALINFTRYLATHLADQNIRANCLSPGGVFNNQSEEFITNYSKLTPLGRMAKADDYQGAILFLMSDASTYMTGANLVVDGGWTAW